MNNDMTYDQLFVTSRDRMEEIMKAVLEKCDNDKIFEQALLSDPTETLKKEGLELQPGMSVQIVKTEEEASLLSNNVIPLSIGNKQNSLSLKDLEDVAGGCEGTGLTAQFCAQQRPYNWGRCVKSDDLD
jgi:hypothetical protein